MNKKSFSFIDYITDREYQPRLGDPRAPTLWPSEASCLVDTPEGKQISGACRRAVFFRYITSAYEYEPEKFKQYKSLISDLKKEIIEPDRYLVWIWKMGEMFEDYLIQQAKNKGVYIDGQISVWLREIKMSGKIDIIIINPNTGKYSVVEAKSVYGFGGSKVLGTESQRRGNPKKGILPAMGVPKDSNIMQIALYQWHLLYSKRDHSVLNASTLEDARLTYGSRDTGVYGEFLIRVEENGDVYYRYNGPIYSDTWIKHEINVLSIHKEYQYVLDCVKSNIIPDRDYELLYPQSRVEKLYKLNLLTETDKKQFEKIQERLKENIDRIAKNLKPKVNLKDVEVSDWRCKFCQYQSVCYDKNKKAKTLSKIG